MDTTARPDARNATIYTTTTKQKPNDTGKHPRKPRIYAATKHATTTQHTLEAHGNANHIPNFTITIQGSINPVQGFPERCVHVRSHVQILTWITAQQYAVPTLTR